MSVWKQLVLSLVILVAAAAAWVRFFPGADVILSRWGIEWAAAAVRPETPPSAAGTGEGRRQGGGGAVTGVVTAAVTRATINDTLTAIGTGRANSSVTVNPYASGRLTEIAVAPGRMIEAGDVIARLDSDSEEIAVDRARIAVDNATAALERVKALRASNTATVVQLTDAEVALDNARLELRDAELALARRTIISPISGVVGILPSEAGDQVTTQSAIATIDDRSRIIVDFWVPERFASAIAAGQPLTAFPIARPSEMFEGTVSAVDNRLDEASRTLLVQAALDNSKDTLRAGMSFQVSMKFPGDSYPAVSPLAIQWGTDGAFVWAVVDGKAKRTTVRIVQRNTETVLIEAAIAIGDLVVVEGVHAVREGAEIMVAERGEVGQEQALPPRPAGT
jgi:RND family efflux transporter MFP subunit